MLVHIILIGNPCLLFGPISLGVSQLLLHVKSRLLIAFRDYPN